MEETKTAPESAPLADTTDKTVVGNEEGKSSPTDVSKSNDAGKSTTVKPATTVPGFDPETRFKELSENYSKLEKRHRDAEKFGTQSSMKAAEMEKKLDQLTQMLAKATEVKIDPQEFLRDVNARGHLPIVELLQKEIAKARAEIKKEFDDTYSPKLSAAESKALVNEANYIRLAMKQDSVNFPNYAELEKEFGKILEEENNGIHDEWSMQEQLVALYNIAKSRNAENAIKQAHAEGKKEAETELAKEAKTKIAGGGKASGTTVPNIDDMNVEDARKALISIYGVADR